MRPECEHIAHVICHKKKQVLAGKMVMESCGEIVSDYIHPVCGHIFPKPRCDKKRAYEAGAIPKCVKEVG